MTSIGHQYVENGTIKYIDVGNEILQLKNDDNGYNLNLQGETPTIFVQQGQYVIPVDGHAVILQDDQGDVEQYIINNVDEDSQGSGDVQDGIGQPIIYYTGEFAEQSGIFDDEQDETTHVIDEIVEDENKQFKLEPTYSIQNYEVDQENDNSNAESNFLQVQDATGILLNEGSDKIIIATDHQSSQYQYAILKNGKLHLQTLDVVDAVHYNTENNEQSQQLQEKLEAFQQSITMDEMPTNTATVDLDKITGRNLITGQTVTLDSYFYKLQRRLSGVDVSDEGLTHSTKKRRRSNNTSSQESPNVNKKMEKDSNVSSDSFINKKIIVGKTPNGKRIVGRIVRFDVKGNKDEKNCSVEKSQPEGTQEFDQPIQQDNTVSSASMVTSDNMPITAEENEEPDLPDDSNESSDKLLELDVDNQDKEQLPSVQPQIIIKKHLVTRENFDHNVGKTLSGLMDLETVQRSLQNKNLVVKLVEKLYDRSMDEFNRTVSYVYGHMELIQYDSENSINQQWTFVLHNDNIDLRKNSVGNNEDPNENQSEEQTASNCDEQREETTNIPVTTTASEVENIEDQADEVNDSSLGTNEVWTPFDETASLTITITVDKNGKKSTRVNLSPQQTGNRCNLCNKEFKTAVQLRKHLNNLHLPEKLVKCNACEKTFTNYNVLQRHQKIHTSNGRWYHCPKCSKSFNSAGSLKRHLTVHDPSLRPLECTVCTQRFTDESSLRKHLLIHTGIRAYACDVCNRAFVNQGDLNFHRRIHDPVKQFRCEICGQEFSRHSNLVRHAEIHRGSGALYRCDICGCSYSFVSSLTRHIVQKHIHQQPQ